MRDDKVLRVLRPSLALAALAAILVLLGLAIVGPAHAATKSPKPEATRTAKAASDATATPSPASTGAIVLQRGTEVRFGENVLVAKGTTVPSVVVFGGDIVVNGRVTDAVVAFGGNVTINGTVGTSTVVFGGDVKLGPKAVVGKDMKPADASLVLFGGNLTQAPGAQIIGQTKSFTGLNWGDAIGWVGHGMFFSPFVGFSFFGWVVQTAFFLVLALVAAALMPRQLRGVQVQLARKPWASLGWGALAFFIAGPAILIVLVISIIGLLLVLPYALFVMLAYFFVTTAVGAFLAQKVLTGFGGRENLMLAVVIGVVGTTVVSRIPVIGPLLLAVMAIIGVGAAILGVAEWRRVRREATAAQAATAAAVAAGATTAMTAPAPASIITPIVQTAPAQPTPAPQSGTNAAAAQTAPAAFAEPVEAPEAPTGPMTEAPEAPAAPAEPGTTAEPEPEAPAPTGADAPPQGGEQNGPATT